MELSLEPFSLGNACLFGHPDPNDTKPSCLDPAGPPQAAVNVDATQ